MAESSCSSKSFRQSETRVTRTPGAVRIQQFGKVEVRRTRRRVAAYFNRVLRAAAGAAIDTHQGASLSLAPGRGPARDDWRFQRADTASAA